MARYGVDTKLSASEVLDRAQQYFGEAGLGLEVISRDNCCLSLGGGGGHVTITVVEGDKTSVDLETREWDYQVKRFMSDRL